MQIPFRSSVIGGIPRPEDRSTERRYRSCALAAEAARHPRNSKQTTGR